MRAFGAKVEQLDEMTWRVQPTGYRATDFHIEPDASAASYFLALPLVTGGQLTLLGAQDSKRGLQGDTEFADVIRAVGADVRPSAGGLEVSFRSGANRVGRGDRAGLHVGTQCLRRAERRATWLPKP